MVSLPTPFWNKAFEIKDLDFLEDEIALLNSKPELVPIDSNRYWEYGKVLKFIKEFIPQPSSFLEVGGGGSSLSPAITTLGHNVITTDIDPNWEKDIRRYIELGYEKLSWKLASAYNLPFAGSSFDCTFCISSIEHMDDYPTCIREMISVTKPNGYIILSFDFTCDDQRSVTSHQLHLFTPKKISEMLGLFPLLEPVEPLDYSQTENNIICYGDSSSVYNGAMLILRKL